MDVSQKGGEFAAVVRRSAALKPHEFGNERIILELFAVGVVVPMAQRSDLFGLLHAAVRLYEVLLDVLFFGHVAAHAERVIAVERVDTVFVVISYPVERDVVMGSRPLPGGDYAVEIRLDALIRFRREHGRNMAADELAAGFAYVVGLFRGDQIDQFAFGRQDGQHVGQRIEDLLCIPLPETAGHGFPSSPFMRGLRSLVRGGFQPVVFFLQLRDDAKEFLSGTVVVSAHAFTFCRFIEKLREPQFVCVKTKVGKSINFIQNKAL